eukprot:GABV01009077.1.p1 GENE.GABV01009077.1~~GABV01009077.1.p1  ORF type:complete len:103 (-),score=22.35 GABV01009077.1:288-596(-)
MFTAFWLVASRSHSTFTAMGWVETRPNGAWNWAVTSPTTSVCTSDDPGAVTETPAPVTTTPPQTTPTATSTTSTTNLLENFEGDEQHVARLQSIAPERHSLC